MIIPEDLQYTEDHEWVKIENEIVALDPKKYQKRLSKNYSMVISNF